MKDSRIHFFAENMDRLSRRDRIILNNPVIMQGLGLAPLVIAANSLGNAVVLATAVLLILTPVRVIATAIGQRFGHIARACIYSLTAGVVYFAAAFTLEQIFGTSGLVSVGIYLPLLVMEPLIIKRYENPQRERVSTSVKKGLITTAGYCLVLFLLAALREFLALGTLGGAVVIKASLLPLAGMPAGGFILLGLTAAVWRMLVAVFRDKIEKGVEELQ